MFRALASAAAIPVRVFSRPSLLLVSTGLSRHPASMSANRPPFTTVTGGIDPSLMMEGMGGGGGIDTPTAGGGGAAGTSEYIKVVKETVSICNNYNDSRKRALKCKGGGAGMPTGGGECCVGGLWPRPLYDFPRRTITDFALDLTGEWGGVLAAPTSWRLASSIPPCLSTNSVMNNAVRISFSCSNVTPTLSNSCNHLGWIL